jgi:hypothetical protein
MRKGAFDRLESLLKGLRSCGVALDISPGGIVERGRIIREAMPEATVHGITIAGGFNAGEHNAETQVEGGVA